MKSIGYEQARAIPEAPKVPKTSTPPEVHASAKRGLGVDRGTHRARIRRAGWVGVGLLATLLAVLAVGATAVHAQPEELPLGSKLPAETTALSSVSEGEVTVSSLLGSTATVFVFWSNQCPWVDKYEERVQSVARDFDGEGVNVVLVNPNDANAFPKESLSASRERAEDAGYATPYVRDPNAAFARALGASRTPHVFVFDAAQTLVYAGTIDDSPGDASNVSKPYLRDALTALTSGSEIPVADTKAFGCTIKFPDE